MYLDPSVSINCKYKIMNNIRLDPLSDIENLSKLDDSGYDNVKKERDTTSQVR